jgi:glycosyltransferase involved in cell wall biosynthesis
MLLKNLNSGLLDVSVCCLGKKGEFGEKIEGLGYKVEIFNRSFGLWDFSTTLALYRYIKKNDFDIIHSSLFYANYHSALAANWAKVPFLITEEHGEHSFHLKKRHIIYRAIGRYIVKKSNIIFCCSNFVKNGIQEVYNAKEEKTIVLRNPIEDKRQEITKSREAMRRELSIPVNAIVMGTVSTLYWIKNQRILIDALSQLKDYDIFLVMSGDGPLRDELTSYSLKIGVNSKIRFTGWRNDVADILNALDVFVLPSLSEGFPISLLEAMSIGLPCIATGVGGIGEIVEDGVTGLLIPPRSLDGLISALKRIIIDEKFRRELGSSARKYVSKYCNPSVYIKRVINLYVDSIART